MGIGFSTLLDIDELILDAYAPGTPIGFSTLLDIDELIRSLDLTVHITRFSTLLDIDELIQEADFIDCEIVLVLCWILMNLYPAH